MARHKRDRGKTKRRQAKRRERHGAKRELWGLPVIIDKRLRTGEYLIRGS